MNKELLKDFLSTCRRHDSVGEGAVCRLLVNEYHATPFGDDTGEDYAYVIEVRSVEGILSPILFSSHVDTVHKDGFTQEIDWDEVAGRVETMAGATGCLGADDGAGMWLLLEMVDAGVPGTYIFHRGEECGGIGSSGMEKEHDEFLKKFTHAIAFDRRGTGDIITHQWRGRCCSEVFANGLADLLNGKDKTFFHYRPDDGGTFTDTANYTELIPECTNVSVGYDHEHGPGEVLDLQHLFALRDRCIEVFLDMPDLPVVRKVTDTDDDRSYSFGDDHWGINSVASRRDRLMAHRDRATRAVGPIIASSPSLDPTLVDEYDIIQMSTKKLRKLIKKNPAGAAELLYNFATQLVNYQDNADEEVDLDELEADAASQRHLSNPATVEDRWDHGADGDRDFDPTRGHGPDTDEDDRYVG